MARLVVVIGPIGAGKSTVARLLAERLVAAGLTVATPDVGDVVAMGSGPPETFEEMWSRGRRVSPCDRTFATEDLPADHIADALAAELLA